MFKTVRVLALLLSGVFFLSYSPAFAVDDAQPEAEQAEVQGSEPQEEAAAAETDTQKAEASTSVTPGSTAPCPTCQKCGDAEKGTVPTVDGYCDIYARQIDYKKSAKEFRDSLYARQKSFEAPRNQALELYRQNLEAIYKEESRVYQEELAREAEEAANAMNADKADEAEVKDEAASADEIPAPEMSEEGVDQTAAVDETAAEGTEVKPGVKEKVLEPSPEGQAPVKKRVIMPEDAPEFDQAPF